MEHHATQPRFVEVAPSERETRSSRDKHSSSADVSNGTGSSQLSPAISLENDSGHQTTVQNTSSLSSGFTQWKTKWITDWWGAEIGCWMIAALSLIGIVIALEFHKNKSPPQWSFGITLNSLISILATTGQMAMMKPIVECISQLKWLWFVRKERIAGFQAFDDASRGPTGCLILLGRLRGLHLVSLGAAVTIVAVAFGPFAQQVVSYPLRLHPTGVATVPQVFNYTGAADSADISNFDVVAATFQGLSRENLSLSSVTPSCASGNCTWPRYSSLGICASVTDVSSTIRSNDCSNKTAFVDIFEIAGAVNAGYPCFNYTLPEIVVVLSAADSTQQLSNATLSNGSPSSSDLSDIEDIGLMEVMSLSSTYGSQNLTTSSVSTSYLMYQPNFLASISSSLETPVAYKLELNLCVQTYNTTVLNGFANTQILSNQTLELADIEFFNVSDQGVEVGGNGSYITLEGNTYGISLDGSVGLNSFFPTVFGALCFDVIPSPVDDPTIAFGQECFCDYTPGNPFLDALTNSSNPLLAVTQLMDNVAISLTNAFRLGAGGSTQVGEFEGTVLTPVIFVDTNYTWLILPIGLVSLTLVFLLATISKSVRLGSRVWKSSNLATLQGLHIDLHNRLGGLSSTSEMEEKVKDLEVRFDMRSGVAEQGVEYRLVESKQEAYWKG